MSRGYSAIGLYHPKYLKNLEPVLRASHCYEASLVLYTGSRYRGDATDTTKAYKHIPMLNVESIIDSVPFHCEPIAVELIEDAKSLFDYIHPESALYIFGPEDGTLGEDVLNRCQDIVYIPTRYCMNLEATVNVVLYDRLMKENK